MTAEKEPGKWCWHCGDYRPLEGQILCNACLEEAEALLVPLISDQMVSLRKMESRCAELEAALREAREKAALADEAAENLRRAHLTVGMVWEEKWLSRYDALTTLGRGE